MRTGLIKKGILMMTVIALTLTLASCGNRDQQGQETEEQSGAEIRPVGIGDRITTDFIDMTVEQAGTADRIKPSDPDPTSFYVTSYVPGSNETFFCVTGTAKNTGGTEYDLIHMYTELVFDGKYHYTAKVLGDSGRDLYGSQMKPLSSVRYYIYASVPDEIIGSFSTVTVQFAFNDNIKAVRRKENFSAYTHRYEISLARGQTAPVAVEEAGPSFTAAAIGDSIVNSFVEMTLDEVVVTDQIKPSHAGSTVYRYLPAPDGQKIFAVKGTAKNVSGDSCTFSNIIAQIIFDDRDTYTAYILGDKGSTLETWTVFLKPQESILYYLYANVPDEVISSYTTCRVQFGFHDRFASTNYISNLKAYENCYEITLGRTE